MRDLTYTSRYLLASIGMRTDEDLYEIARRPRQTEDPTAHAAGALAMRAAMAITHIESAGRAADQALADLARYTAEQGTAVHLGRRRDADWINQAAGNYTRLCQAIETHADAFAAAAGPLAILLGLAELPADEMPLTPAQQADADAAAQP